MARRAFFFPHALDPEQGDRGNRPGRVPYQVRASLIESSGNHEGECWVMADGFRRDPSQRGSTGVVGTNQDPCVFSAPWPPFHSFCRIDGARGGADQRVVGKGQFVADSLPDAVDEGDVIVYGKTTPPSGRALTSVWVDTVLVVADKMVLPTRVGAGKKRPFDLDTARGTLPERDSDAYRFNLGDAESNGMHATTLRDPHLLIRGAVDTGAESLAELRTSFVPLADRPADGAGFTVCGVSRAHVGESWMAMLAFFEASVFAAVRGAGRPNGGWIAEFPSFDLAQSLLQAVIKRSGIHQGLRGTVAVPPLKLLGMQERWDPRALRVVPPGSG